MLMLLASAFTASGYIYPNLLEAGKYAYKDEDYALARYFYTEAQKEIPADSIIDLYIVHNRLRDIDAATSDYDNALNHARRCLDLMRGYGDEAKYRMMEDYLMAAHIYATKKDADKAQCYMDSALYIVSAPGVDNAYCKKFSTMAGIIYSELDNMSMAESMYELSVMYARRYQPSKDTSVTLNLYGNSLFHNSKYPEALKIYEEQREVCRNLFGEDSREYQWTTYLMANMHAYMGNIDRGSALYKDALEWYRQEAAEGLRTLPAHQHTVFLDNMIEIIRNAVPFGMEARYDEDDFTRLAYEGLLFSKGMLLATEKSGDALIRNYGTPEERASLDSLKAMRLELKELRADSAANPVDILNLYAGIKGIDYELAKSCAGYGDKAAFAAVDYETLKSCLKPDEVLLDFTDYKPKSKPRQYVCFEIRKNQRFPRVHYICNGAELDSLLALEKHVWSNLYSGESAADMARIIGAPLKRIIGDSKTVYYVPSGIFHKLAVEAVPEGDGVLGDIYDFRRLSSAREIAAPRREMSEISARLYGGLDYDCAEVAGVADDGVRGGRRLDSLSRSLEEVNEIADMIAGAQVCKGAEGTEQSFLDMSGHAPTIIHLSTHGYYYSPEDADKPVSLQGYDDAMSLTGLVMSGGNAGWMGVVRSQGMLSAEKVARCDLSGTEIVCLASCYSGQGEVTSEGIYGLQRAFKKAGVGTVVMCLWQASDLATKCFMTNFYADLLNGSKDRHKAFRHAQSRVRRQYPSPFYWAGFVMID